MKHESGNTHIYGIFIKHGIPLFMKRRINTPVIKGEDARNFMNNLHSDLCHKHSEEEKKKLKAEVESMKRSYKLMQSLSNGAF